VISIRALKLLEQSSWKKLKKMKKKWRMKYQIWIQKKYFHEAAWN